MNNTWKKINQRACYNSIWSWSPMPCEKHGPRASVTTKTSAFGLGFCLLSPSGHVFHTAWETMIKSYNKTSYIMYISVCVCVLGVFVFCAHLILLFLDSSKCWRTMAIDHTGNKSTLNHLWISVSLFGDVTQFPNGAWLLTITRMIYKRCKS